MKKYGIRAHFAYRFDNLMSRGLIALIGLLLVASAGFVGVVALVVVTFELFPPHMKLTWDQAFWASMLRTLDAGTMGADQGDGFRLAMLVVTIVGLILVASLIGIVSNSFNARVEQLRKGKSRVLESNHTLILGWNAKIHTILHEIALANQSRTKPLVVILADRDKVAMEDEINLKLPHRSNTRIIVRSGDPLNSHDLKIVSPEAARSIIILASDSDSDSDADSASIKACMAVLNSRENKERPYHIVGEIKSEDNLVAAKLVGGDEAHWVLGDDLMSRIIVQTCRQSSLSMVFTELLDFEGAEIYISSQPTLHGLTYGEAILKFSEGCAFGLINGMSVHLNPAPDYVVQPGDDFLVIAEDDSRIKIAGDCKVDAAAMKPVTSHEPTPEKTLILGSNKNLPEIIREMSAYMATGSSVLVVNDAEVPEFEKTSNLTVETMVGDPTSISVLTTLQVTNYDHIIALADRERFSPQQGDARTLLTLLHLRELAKKQGAKLNIVSEMLDDRNRELAESTDADDFIVSDKLVSLMLSQLEESPEIGHVFDQLLSSAGSEIRLHPAEWYVELGKRIDFDTVVAAASKHGDSAIGYSLLSKTDHHNRLYGVELNPNRKTAIEYKSGDRIVVLSNF